TPAGEDPGKHGPAGGRSHEVSSPDGHSWSNCAIILLMKLLVWVDGSQWSDQALAHLARSLCAEDDLLLLYVAPRAKAGYLECGRMVFEAALHHCRLPAGDRRVRCRLEIGEAAERI